MKQFSLTLVNSLPKTFLFQAIQFCQTILIQSIQLSINIVFVHTQINIKTVLFQTIQFSISTQFSSIWPIGRSLSGATTPDQSRSGSDGNEGGLRIPQRSSITGTSPSDSLVSYPGHSLWGSYSSVEMQSVYSTAPADWEKLIRWLDTFPSNPHHRLNSQAHEFQSKTN